MVAMDTHKALGMTSHVKDVRTVKLTIVTKVRTNVLTLEELMADPMSIPTVASGRTLVITYVSL